MHLSSVCLGVCELQKNVLPVVLIELVREVCEVLHKPVGVCCNPQVQQSRLGGFRTPPYFCCFSLCSPLSSCCPSEYGAHWFTTATGTDRRESLEGRDRET